MLLAYDAELVPEAALRKSKLRPLEHFLEHLDVGVHDPEEQCALAAPLPAQL